MTIDTVTYLADFRRRLELPAIVDVHTHFMPDQVMRKVWAYFDTAGPLTGRPWPITYRDDEQVRLKTLRDFGVRAFTSLVYPHKPNMGAWLNEWTAEFAARTPDCLHTATFYPEPDAPRYVAEAIERGARIFKVHIQVGGFSPLDPLLDPVWSILADSGVPVLIHCGSGPAPGDVIESLPIPELPELAADPGPTIEALAGESVIDNEYRRLGGPGSSIGAPIGPEMLLPQRAGTYRLYTNGVIVATKT
uniref:amidohydrolase family protein n=1 Tax=Nocardia sp. GTS18 TaxID=1778064 RepID=UPI0021057107